MTRAMLVALGTRGDVEPFVRLGRCLRVEGYEVCVAVLADGRARVEQAGLRAVVVGPGSAEVMWSRRAAVRRAAYLNPGLMYLQMHHALRSRAAELATGLSPIFAGADVALVGLAAARLVPVLGSVGVPARLVLTAPLLPHPGGVSVWAGPVADHLPTRMERARQHLLWRMTTGLSEGLAQELSRAWGAAGGRAGAGAKGRASHHAPWLATSPVLDPDAAIPAAGWWADRSPVRALPDGVHDYLRAHPRTVLLALGSLPTRDAERTVRRLLTVAESLGAGAVVQVAGAAPGPRPTGYVLPEVDHRALLPRLCAVVHHGGSGTTHAATLAGVPQVVVPHLGDQAHYARRVRSAGLGPAPLRPAHATAARLRSRLRVILDDPSYAARARAAGRAMAREDGLGAAVRAVGELAG